MLYFYGTSFPLMPKQISIPKPCHESWQNMTPCSGGRFCGSCTTKVHDFTERSISEISKTIDEAESKVCGTFYNYQLDNPKTTTEKVLHRLYTVENQFFKRFASASILMILFFTGCGKKVGEPALPQPNDTTQTPIDSTQIAAITAEYNTSE